MHVLIPALHRPSKPTGVCRHAANLARCLAHSERVSRVTLVLGSWQKSYFEQSFNLTSSKIKLIFVDIKNTSLSRNQWFVFELPRLARQQAPHLIHMAFPFPFVRQWFKAPIVSTIHDLYPYECPENFGYPQVWFNQLFLQQCVRNSDALSCVSQCTLEALNQYFPQVERNKQTAVVYNIVDFEDVESKRPHQLNSDFSDPFLLAVAQHRKNKNLDLLVKTYHSLLHQDALKSDTRLLLVGSPGPETNYLTDLVQTLKLERSVLFLSSLEDEELRWLYENAALFVIPSSTEGFCLPLVEALTLSCQVVCSDIPIFREVGAFQCSYFQLGEHAPENLSKAILTELSCKKTEKIVNPQFSKDEVSQSLLKLYDTLTSCF
ncbi:glycosyltransferase family 4 protein [Altericista sp. CCNU0014]|uniref:glycosyltransferase family 4 protein n=1 Tax=Altericista sp. CCNU0014 TaxID=3082949 RepID=UPI003850580C